MALQRAVTPPPSGMPGSIPGQSTIFIELLWRNRYTRQLEGLVGESPCQFDPGQEHQLSGDVAHLGERLFRKQKVVGSSPIISTSFSACGAVW